MITIRDILISVRERCGRFKSTKFSCGHNLFSCFILSLPLGLLLFGCAPSRPGMVMSPEEMADVLYDMHLAQTLYDDPDVKQSDADIIMLRNEVLKKHDISVEEWDSSFNYYCRNTYELHGIYKRIEERLDHNVMMLGGKVEGMQGDDADTCNVWGMESAVVLMQQAPFNKLTFEVTPDSTFEDGDKITLQFDAQMIFQDGYKDLTACLAVYYDNDSVATGVRHVNSDQHCVIAINNEQDRLHVKSIKGYLLLLQNLAQETTQSAMPPLRFVAISSIKLLHQHTKNASQTVKVDTGAETLKADSAKTDSIKRDSVNEAIPKPNT